MILKVFGMYVDWCFCWLIFYLGIFMLKNFLLILDVWCWLGKIGYCFLLEIGFFLLLRKDRVY